MECMTGDTVSLRECKRENIIGAMAPRIENMISIIVGRKAMNSMTKSR